MLRIPRLDYTELEDCREEEEEEDLLNTHTSSLQTHHHTSYQHTHLHYSSSLHIFKNTNIFTTHPPHTHHYTL